MEWKIGLFGHPEAKPITYIHMNTPKTRQPLHTDSWHQNEIKMELQGNKTKRRSGNEAAKENRTDFAKVRAI